MEIDMQMIRELYEVPAIRERLAKLTRRAEKLGAPVPTMTVSEPWREKVTEFGFERVATLVEIEVSGEPVRLAGWKFLATIDVTGTTPVLRRVPGSEDEDLPTHFRNTDGTCDHCGTRRYRKDVFVIRHDNGEYKQVGRNCLQDFLGGDPAQILWFVRAFNKMTDEVESEGWGSASYDPFKMDWTATEVLRIAAWAVRTMGYVPRSADYGIATSTIVRDVLWSRDKASAELRRQYHTETHEGDVEVANRAYEWVEALPGKSDFEHNMKAVFETVNDVNMGERVVVRGKNIGFAAYAVAGYLRSLETEKKVRKEREEKANDHVGEVGKREDFKVRLVGKTGIDGRYGMVVIHRFEDEHGNALVWFASTEGLDIDPDEFVTIKATVKAHDDFKGRNQTKINRVAVVS